MVQDREHVRSAPRDLPEAVGEGSPQVAFGLALGGSGHEYDPWGFVRPLRAVSTVPAHRVGGRRYFWRACTRRLDRSADRARLLSDRVLLGWPLWNSRATGERPQRLAAGSFRSYRGGHFRH